MKIIEFLTMQECSVFPMIDGASRNGHRFENKGVPPFSAVVLEAAGTALEGNTGG